MWTPGSGWFQSHLYPSALPQFRRRRAQSTPFDDSTVSAVESDEVLIKEQDPFLWLAPDRAADEASRQDYAQRIMRNLKSYFAGKGCAQAEDLASESLLGTGPPRPGDASPYDTDQAATRSGSGYTRADSLSAIHLGNQREKPGALVSQIDWNEQRRLFQKIRGCCAKGRDSALTGGPISFKFPFAPRWQTVLQRFGAGRCSPPTLFTGASTTGAGTGFNTVA
jgi:hypothetical protein